MLYSVLVVSIKKYKTASIWVYHQNILKQNDEKYKT